MDTPEGVLILSLKRDKDSTLSQSSELDKEGEEKFKCLSPESLTWDQSKYVLEIMKELFIPSHHSTPPPPSPSLSIVSKKRHPFS